MQSGSGLTRCVRTVRWHDVLLGLLIFLVVAGGTVSFSQLPPSTGAPAVGQKAPDFTLPDRHGKMVSLSGLLKSKETPKLKGIVLIFYRGYWWPYCVSELRSFQSALNDFSEHGIHVVAISVDPVSDSLGLSEKAGLTFPLLSDPDKKVISAYDLQHAGGHRGADIARPAEFLLDRSGTVRWVNLTSDFRVRVRGDEVLKIAEERLHLRAEP